MKKLIALTLCLIIFMSLLAGCNTGSSSEGGGLGNIVVGGKPVSNVSETILNEIEIPDEDIKLSVDKTSYAPGELLTVIVSGVIPEQMIRENGSIIIFMAGDGHDGNMNGYHNLQKGVSQYEFYVPDINGTYEARFYKNASTGEESFLTMVSFDVSGPSVSNSVEINPFVFGLWRNSGDNGVSLYGFSPDESFRFDIRYTDGTEDELMTGRYLAKSETTFIMYDIIYNGGKVDGEFDFIIEVSGDMMVIDGELCERVLDEYAEDVLADPFAPYPPGSIENIIDIDPELLKGLWRNSDDEGNVAVYNYDANGKFKLMVFYSNGEKILMTGKYTVSRDQIVRSQIIYNGEKLDGDDSIYAEIYGDQAIFNGELCQRVPEEYAAAVLADPKAPYPPKSGNNNNNNENNGNNNNGNNNGGAGERGSLTADIFNILSGDTYHMKYRGISGEVTDTVIEIYTKLGLTAILMNVDGMEIRTVMGDGRSFMIFDSEEFILASTTSEEDETSYVGDTANLIYVGEGSGNFNGKTYKYDEYKDYSGGQYFYYVDSKTKTLKGIRTVAADGTINEMEILALDKNVPSSVFNIPDNYEIMEY